jgi:hypothetical protein
MRAAPEREFMPGIELRTFSIKASQAYYIALTINMAYFGNWFSKMSICISLSRAAATSHNYSDMLLKYNQQILALQQHSVCCQDWKPIYLSTV